MYVHGSDTGAKVLSYPGPVNGPMADDGEDYPDAGELDTGARGRPTRPVPQYSEFENSADDWFKASPAPKAEPEGARILNDVHAFLARFIAHPGEHSAVAHTLWISHAHAMDAWESTPRIAFVSPEPGSGKTRALEATELLVPRPIEAVNVTPSYLFRKVADEAGRPTILFDEIDTIFGPRAKDNEEIRGLLNAGHRQGAVAGRCVVKGKIVTTEEIPAYCAVALAGLGDLPDTIFTRSVITRMRKRAPDEHIEPFRRRDVAPEGHALRDRLASWLGGIEAELAKARPEMPDGIRDRDADVWEPLLAIAEAACGDWPERARKAATAIVTASKETSPSLGVRLLSDIRDAFGAVDAMPTKRLLEELNGMEEAPWGDLRGKPLNERGLAGRLRKYGVKSRNIRIGESTPKGYRKEDFYDAWKRYLLPSSTP